jgi:hypothetical protein
MVFHQGVNMPLLTFSGTPEKGVSSTISLSKSILANLSRVTNDPYYSDTANWSTVTALFRSNEISAQRSLVLFDASATTPTSSFFVSDKAAGDFLIDKIIIKDFDGGYFSLSRSDLGEIDFDAIFAAAEQPSFTRIFNTTQELFESSDTSSDGMTGSVMWNDAEGYLSIRTSEVVNFESAFAKYILTIPTEDLVIESGAQYEIELQGSFFTAPNNGSNLVLSLNGEPIFSDPLTSVATMSGNPETITVTGVAGMFATNVFELELLSLDSNDEGTGGDEIQLTQLKITKLP